MRWPSVSMSFVWSDSVLRCLFFLFLGVRISMPVRLSCWVHSQRYCMVCNVLTPFVSLVQSTLKFMPNFGSTTKGSVAPSCDGTAIVRTHEIVAMVPRCLCHPGNHFQVTSAPKRKPTEPPEDTPVDVESLDTPAPSTSCVHESVHPVQFGIMTSFPALIWRNSIWLWRGRLVHTGWIHCLGETDPELILEQHFVSKSGAMTDRLSWPPWPEAQVTQSRVSFYQRCAPPFAWADTPQHSELELDEAKKAPSKTHIGEKWHIIALQEAIEYFQHECLTSHFHLTRCARCAILFKKDTFHPGIKVSSIYLHDTRNGQQQVVNEGQLGWVFQAVISRVWFRRLPPNGKSFSTMMSLHTNHFVKKRGLGKKHCYMQSVL